MTAGEIISLKEYFEKLMQAEKESMERALKLQSSEYERRLTDLNHKAEQLKDMQMTYLPRETYEVQHKQLTDRFDDLARLVYIGLGIAIVVEIVLRFIK